jgi:hypothetical protein
MIDDDLFDHTYSHHLEVEMNKTLKIVLIVTAALVVTGGLLVAGFLAGRIFTGRLGFYPGSMMYARSGSYPAQPGVGNQNVPAYDRFDDLDRVGRAVRPGIGNRMDDRSYYGCGGCYSNGTAAATAEPLSIEAAETAVQKYLDTLNNDDLTISEVMIFDNQAYARVVEKSTGMGAMELLVDNATQAVYPEHGANMMWNQKYSPMNGRGMMGRGMRGFGGSNLVNPTVKSAEDMTVNAEQAAQIAQDYLNQSQSGEKVGEAEPFYGYYTLDILKDGKVNGMLSVNGFSGQIIVHTWHGTFIEMSEE